jgi:chemotaxis signal transduction protein
VQQPPPSGYPTVIASLASRQPPTGGGEAAATAATAGVVGGNRLALLIPVAGDTVAVPLEAVREVAVAPRVTRLPTAPAMVLGVFNLRGEIVPLFDTGLLLGLRAIQRGAFAVLVDSSHGVAGLAATEMPLTVRLVEALLSPARIAP